MEIQFLGGASEVGRSGILLKDSSNILLDYGVKINGKTEYPLSAGHVDTYILSHGHLDHSGASPMIYKESAPKAIGTQPTLQFAEMLIKDSIKIGKKRHLKPKYSKHEVRMFSQKYTSYGYGELIEIKDHYVTLYDAGHISGSAITLIEKARTDKKLVYTGDFKLEPQLLQNSAQIVKGDILLIESTYANREHPNRDKLIRLFIEDVKNTIEKGGIALLPVFAVGRAQEMLAMLYKHNMLDNTYIDGMAREATEIVLHNPEFMVGEPILANAIKRTNWISHSTERDAALDGSSIIVTTAGMLNGGPVLNYITRLNPLSKIFLTGYQVEGTNGRMLIDKHQVVIDGKRYTIKQPVSYYDFSAHAGKNDLFEYVRKSSPSKVICVHGDQNASSEFAEALKLEGFDAIAPKVGDKIKVEF